MGSSKGLAKPKISEDEFATPAGRRRAWRDLMIHDHGLLRKFYSNTHEISPGKLWRTYQPSPSALENWQKRGIKTVVNLRGDKPSGFYFLEREACAQLNLTLKTFRVFSRDAPTLATFAGARDLFASIDYPAIIHCKSGADRAGLMATLYLFFHEGLPLDQAVDQLSFKYGHIKQGKTGVIDFAFEEFFAYAHENDKSLSSVADFMSWAQTVYDPAETKKRFRAKGWGNLLTETLLRRE